MPNAQDQADAPESMNKALAEVWFTGLAEVWNQLPEYEGHVATMLQVARALQWNPETMDPGEYNESMYVVARYVGAPEAPLPGPLPRPPARAVHERNLAAIGLSPEARVNGALPNPNYIAELAAVYDELRRENPLDFAGVMWLALRMDETNAFLPVYSEFTFDWYIRALFLTAKHAAFLREARKQALLAHAKPPTLHRM